MQFNFTEINNNFYDNEVYKEVKVTLKKRKHCMAPFAQFLNYDYRGYLYINTTYWTNRASDINVSSNTTISCHILRNFDGFLQIQISSTM